MSRGDSNASGEVDVGDIMIVAALWNQPAGPPYDLDGDGVITVVDIGRVARWWGWPVPYSLASPGGWRAALSVLAPVCSAAPSRSDALVVSLPQFR